MKHVFSKDNIYRALIAITLVMFLVAPAKGSDIASWYGPGFHGKMTANGEIYNQNALTCAHLTLPFNTLVRVTNLNNGLSRICRINDRGPARYTGRSIDISKQMAYDIQMIESGIAPVRIDVLE